MSQATERGRRVRGLAELAQEGAVPMRVRGGSMAPLLSDGDRLEVGPARRYWPGDVVAFHDAAGRLVVHRLLGWWPLAGRMTLLTAGDAAEAPDPLVPCERLVGRVRGTDAQPAVLAVPPAARARALVRWLGFAARRAAARLGSRGR